jgi:hypothetical protein
MGREDRIGRRGRGEPAAKDAADKAKKGLKVERLRALWPELRALVGPRRNLLLLADYDEPGQIRPFTGMR